MPSLDIEGRPLFLIGFMGTGKSTIGRLLAARLGRAFVDLDERIELEANSTIAEIFAAEGETGFRAREQLQVRRVCDPKAPTPEVIAAGGGAPVQGDNLERMLQAGVVIALSASVDELLERIGDAKGRPLLAAAGSAGRRAEIERLLSERAGVYARAHLSIDTSGLAPSKVVASLLDELGAC